MGLNTTKLIKDLRTQAKACREDGVPVTVAILIEEAADRLEHLAKEKEIDIPSDYPKLDPKLCECDPNVFKEIVDERINKIRSRDELPKM